MNRNEEYNTLLRELDQTPPELEYTVTRAKARARRHQARRWVGVPVGTLAGAFAAFVLLEHGTHLCSGLFPCPGAGGPGGSGRLVR